MTKVAVYPGSFNPLHKGHLAVIRYLLADGGFDKVYLVVSPHNPFKDPAIADNCRERLESAIEAIERNCLSDCVIVEDIEFSMPQPSYTINTLDALRSREADKRFTLVIGADNLPEMLRWKEGERILEEYGVAVYPREGFNMTRDCSILKEKHKNDERLFGNPDKHVPYRIKLLKAAPMVNISSTQIRQLRAEGKNIEDFVI